MHSPHINLLIISILVNVCVWTQYAVMKVRPTDFGAIRSNRLRMYLLVTAAVEYVSKLSFVAIIAASTPDEVSPTNTSITTVAIAAYYMLLLGFLPLVRASLKGSLSKGWVQGLLALCILPSVAMLFVALQVESTVLLVLSIVSLVHVAVNDSIIYAGRF